jgi:hypothetical protein
MKKVTKTKSDHARKLFADGHSTAEVARIANVNYGHAWNIRKGMLAKVQAEPTPEPKPAPKADKVEAILAKRGRDYGDYPQKAGFIQHMKLLIRMSPNWFALDSDMRESMDMIAHKMGRIAYGDPSHLDSWVDIAGYAKLVSDRLQGTSR